MHGSRVFSNPVTYVQLNLLMSTLNKGFYMLTAIVVKIILSYHILCTFWFVRGMIKEKISIVYAIKYQVCCMENTVQ